ncbi:MAG: adenylosuccinate synthetase, partial [Patescibacteria group bacterium]
GGANAGHTIETNEGVKVALQQIPSGIFYPDKLLYVGSGCVINIEKITLEIDRLKQINVDLSKRLRLSCQASIIQP